ncbi:MAG: hypothetical protein ABIZ69_04755, partial [Ilumatobacteraceae bacterium]
MSGVGVATECALRRVRTRKGRLSATVVAIAVGISGLILVGVASTIAGDRALQRGIADLDPTERAFTVSMSPDLSPTAADLASINSKVDGRLQRHGLGRPLHTVEFRALPAGDGRAIRFAGIDDVQDAARLVDGRWPTRCDPQACEVVGIVPASADPRPVEPFPPNSQLGLTVVGTAVATSDLLLQGEMLPGAGEVIMIADGVADASALPAYQLFRRTYAWQIPIVPGEVRSIDVEPMLDAVRAVGNDATLSGLHVSGPEDELLTISSRTRITGNRLAVPMGALLVLFFGVAVLAGLGGRTDHRRTSFLLRRRGASSSAIAFFRMLEAALPVIGGVVGGVVLALSFGGWFGRRSGVGGWSVLSRSIDGSLVLATVAVAVAVWLLIV